MKTRQSRLLASVIFGLLLSAGPCSVFAQKAHPYDSSYYKVYPNMVMARVYYSQKFESVVLRTPGNVRDLDYRPNSKLDLGIGATYKNVSLNVAYGFGFLNNKNDKKGATKGLDAQLHLFPYKWAIDATGIFHNGHYLMPEGYAANPNSYYYRPDIKNTIVGLAAYRVPNAGKFSSHAALIQSERQIKSAGSLLYGGNAYFISLRGDSSLVPASLEKVYPQAGVTKINSFIIGPGIGYAYTLVIAKYFFITPSVITNLDLNFTSEEGAAKQTKFGVRPVVIYKGAVGYNSDSWSLAATVTGNAFLIRGAASPKDYFLQTGAFRVMLARKLFLKKS